MIAMASALNSKMHSKTFMCLYKFIVDVVVIYYYLVAELEELKRK